MRGIAAGILAVYQRGKQQILGVCPLAEPDQAAHKHRLIEGIAFLKNADRFADTGLIRLLLHQVPRRRIGTGLAVRQALENAVELRGKAKRPEFLRPVREEIFEEIERADIGILLNVAAGFQAGELFPVEFLRFLRQRHAETG